MKASPFDQRASGILLHPSSLPGRHGSGDLGPSAHRFAEFLARSGQTWWQMLPVGPLGGGDSPYDSPSTFAGNPLLVSLDLLARDGLLQAHEIEGPRLLAESKRCHFAATRRFRDARLRRAFQRFEPRATHDFAHELGAFRERNRHWLPGFTQFRALARAHRGKTWSDWEPDLALRRPEALERASRELSSEIAYEEFVQFMFDRQWNELHRHCRELGILLLGDVPMFVAHNGADVWQNRDIFQLDERGHRRVLAGVPPDYFSADGQLWGNPLYDWDKLQQRGYDWWIARLAGTLARFDAVRLDHFIAFHRYWEVPSWATSAREGRFVAVPGRDFFRKLRDAVGGLPFIAEDLGLVTEEVHALREEFALPGMRVLEFAFGSDFRDYQPHRFSKSCVVYTGTHDNDTIVGWLDAWKRATDSTEKQYLLAERERALRYAGSDGKEPHWDFIRLALASVANTAIFPLQDVLGEGTSERMNTPGTASGNWGYRCRAEDWSVEVGERLGELCETYERIPRRG